MSQITNWLFVMSQRVIPKHLLTAIVFRLARIRVKGFKNFLVRHFVNLYGVDVGEVALPVPDGFESFNEFFIRELKIDARPIAVAQDTIASPVDGTVSASGLIENDAIFQAKGLSYSLFELLATDTNEAAAYINGAFATIYLAPHNYHRVHAPLDGTLAAARYVPGKLFSVNEATVTGLPQLFVRNERLILHLHTSGGPMVLIFVGAMNVGSISTKWTGTIRPRKTGVVEQIGLDPNENGHQFRKGDCLGWFNMGSTVILLAPGGATDEFGDIAAKQTVKMGEAIGHTMSTT